MWHFQSRGTLLFMSTQYHDGFLNVGKMNIWQRLFIGVDSAPMHIAAAVGTPVIALFGPTGKEWIPYGEGNTVVSKDMPCKPCKKGMCEGIGLRDCMTAINPDDVKE